MHGGWAMPCGQEHHTSWTLLCFFLGGVHWRPLLHRQSALGVLWLVLCRDNSQALESTAHEITIKKETEELNGEIHLQASAALYSQFIHKHGTCTGLRDFLTPWQRSCDRSLWYSTEHHSVKGGIYKDMLKCDSSPTKGIHMKPAEISHKEIGLQWPTTQTTVSCEVKYHQEVIYSRNPSEVRIAQ